MLNERAPFNIAEVEKSIEEALQAPTDRGAISYPSTSVRRRAPGPDRPRDEQATPDLAAIGSASGSEDSDEARPALLEARESTHGSFADNARVSQAIKRVFRAEPGWKLLTDVERESMDMIALKFSRILSGKSLELQHWEDVVGYGHLAEEQCKPA